MSAIWGQISFSGEINQAPFYAIQQYYEKHCKIEHYHSMEQKSVCFHAGIQHITAQAAREQLPIFDALRNTLFVADCILDNRIDLIQELNAKGQDIRNNTDIPDGTLMYLCYQYWGMECVRLFRGVYSFAVYDGTTDTLYLASDHTASRCLYYCRQGNTFAFSTLLEPIRMFYPQLTLNDAFIKDFLTAPGLMPNVVSTETPYQNVYKLNPGTYLTITKTSICETTYWTPSERSFSIPCRTASEYGSFFRKLFESCVRDTLHTCGNIGISMSSGLDSASVGAVAARALAAQNLSLHTYTYVPYEKPSLDRNRHNVHDETEDVKKILAMHPNMIPQFLTNEGKNCFQNLQRDLEIMEIPYKAYGNLPSLFEIYSIAYKDGCRIVLTGQTGNSTISHGYIDDVLYDLYARKRYLSFVRYLNRYSPHVKESRKAALRECIRYFNHANSYYRNYQWEYTPDNPFLASDILTDYPIAERYTKAQVPMYQAVPTPSAIYRRYLGYNSMYTYLGELDTKAGLAHGIVLRDPTRDKRMLEFCYQLPYHYFAYHGTPRWLIRNNLRDILPTQLLDDWLRYGVQNSDCNQRIARDFDTLYPTFTRVTASPGLTKYINSEKINRFLESAASGLQPDEEDNLLYFSFLFILANYLEIKNL